MTQFLEVWKNPTNPITERHDAFKLLHSLRTREEVGMWEVVVDSTFGGSSEAVLEMGQAGTAVFAA